MKEEIGKTETLRVAVVGLGNLLLGDEGFGIHLIRYLETNFPPLPGVEIIDGGCLGLKLLDLMREKEALLLVDVYLSEEPPGTVRIFSWEELKKLPTKNLASAHQWGIKEALSLAELEGLKPYFFKVYGVVPERLGLGTELSPTLAQKIPIVAKQILKELKELGVLEPEA